MIYSWGHAKRYNDYSQFIKKTFGERVQKVSVNAGFTCPNRDGSKGTGGCSFCNNSTFNPAYCEPELKIIEQLEKGMSFFRPKYQTQKYLAYFQAYSNTYGETTTVIAKYKEALAHPLICGLIIGTRPDCISPQLLEYLQEVNKTHYVVIELGAESTNNATLQSINRGHSWEETIDAARMIHHTGIAVGLHLILGLPGEDRAQILEHATAISKLPITFLKLHQLQIVKGSEFGRIFETNPSYFNLFTEDDFIELVIDFIELIKPQIVVERFISQAPYNLLLAPNWGTKNFEFVHKVEKRLNERDTYQGRLYH